MNNADAAGIDSQSYLKPKKMAVFGIGLLFFLILGAIAWTLCNFRIQYTTQSILTRQRDMQQAWMGKSLDAIQVWRNQLAEQARFISSSEMLRLFVMDASTLAPSELARLSDPDMLDDPDDTLRSMAEQLHYIEDLLHDFTQRRAWQDARILLPDGSVIAEPPFSARLDDRQIELARQAAAAGTATYGPIRRSDQGLMMDVADPLFEVLGADEPKILAVLLLSVPVDRQLQTFLAQGGTDTAATMLPRIVDPDGDRLFMAFANGGNISLEPVAEKGLKLENMPFGLRNALDGKGEVYSSGGMPTLISWLFVLETPAAEISAQIHDQEVQIYGLGALGSLGLALLAAWIWAGRVSRRNAAEAQKFKKLYNTIRNQKMVLDSMNASFQAGLVLVDAYGRIQISNPAFAGICQRKEEIPPGTPLAQTLPDKAAIRLLEDIGAVTNADHPASDEITLLQGNPPEERLYRVTLYPYTNAEDSGSRGCVAVLQDITEFRRKAEAARIKSENERQRQAALISAFVRAVESVDPHLVGHSDKMAAVSDLLATELDLTDEERETLNLAAKLSQVGKIYVPRELLNKKGKLSPEELQELRRAPEYADRILHDMRFNLPVRETVGLIGERFNGTGKPLGLAGEDIPLCGRALAVINAFIAMTSRRAWRDEEAMGVGDAIAQLLSDPGFDPHVVQALQKVSHSRLDEIVHREEPAQ